jgi:hypothetical protein
LGSNQNAEAGAQQTDIFADRKHGQVRIGIAAKEGTGTLPVN